jgi:hypothetical protein
MQTNQEFDICRYGIDKFCYGVDGTHVLVAKPRETELPPVGINCQDFWCRKQECVT